MKLSLVALAGAVVATSAEDVFISLDCQGTNYDSLTAQSLSFASKAVQAAFNDVHRVDEQVLSDVSAEGTTLISMGELQEGKLRGKQCNKCGGGDDELFQVALSFSGDLGQCNKCGGGDDTFSFVQQAKLAAWESKLTSMLNSSPHAAFKKANMCSIKVDPIEQDFDFSVERPVSIKASCAGLSEDDLSVRSIHFSSKALTASFQSAFSATEGTKLENVSGAQCNKCGGGDDEFVASSTIIFSATNVGQCNKCGGGDDMVVSTKEAHAMWEKIYTANLLKDPMGDFLGVTGCKISISA